MPKVLDSELGFSDSVRALSHVEQGCEDCKAIISDIMMPNINGFQLVQRVKELRPEMKAILMTAFEVSMSEFKAVLRSTPVDNVLREAILTFHAS